MSIVTLVSGGLDSTLMAVLAREAGIEQFPLFIDYGQRSRDLELRACRQAMASNQLPEPAVARVPGYGALIHSGLTDPKRHLVEDAFTPCRNLLFLVLGAAHAYQIGADAVTIGLLNEETSIFPDQSSSFLASAELTLSSAIGRQVRVLAPLREFYKKDVVHIASSKGISGTYSCHAGGEAPCGECISCKEFQF